MRGCERAGGNEDVGHSLGAQLRGVVSSADRADEKALQDAANRQVTPIFGCGK